MGRVRREHGGGSAGRTRLSPPRPAEHLALRVHDGDALIAQAGSGLPGPAALSMADGLPAPGPQHALAVLQGPSREAAGAAAPHGEDRRPPRPDRLGGAGRGRNESAGQRVRADLRRAPAGLAPGAHEPGHRRSGGAERERGRPGPAALAARAAGGYAVAGTSVGREAGDGGDRGSPRQPDRPGRAGSCAAKAPTSRGTTPRPWRFR